MARPKKSGNLRALEIEDTMHWCGLIKAHSGLSDAAIEENLALGLNPTGRNFNRWLTGKRAMSHSYLQTVVKKAREEGLLRPRKSLSTLLEVGIEERAGQTLKMRASENLEEALSSIHKLHTAKRALNQAAKLFQEAAAAAAGKYDVEIFDTIKDVPGYCPDELLESTDTDSIAERIGEIASWYLFQGRTHGLE